MPNFDRNCFRLACLLQQGIRRLQASALTQSTFGRHDLEHCLRLFHKLEKARSRNLPLAAATLDRGLEKALSRLQERLASHLNLLASRSAAPKVPSLDHLYCEVAGLSEEFDKIHHDLKQRLIVVTTEPIELDDVCLGAFEIRLSLNRLGEYRPYEVVAVDAKPSAADHAITHPHVKDNHLCEGDGRMAIRQALATGRLADFFQIVNQVLHTYNAGSAYAELETWSGVCCADCGDVVGADDACDCHKCETQVCNRCTSVCPDCSGNFCSECSQACKKCRRRFCDACSEKCSECEEPFCQSCLSNGKCRDCHDCDPHDDENGDGEARNREAGIREAGDAPETPRVSAAASQADITIQPAGLGQTPVPA
jgi:hypothetical protein